MSARSGRRPRSGQSGLPGLEYERTWSRRSPRTADPLHAADACPGCDGTGVDIDTPESDGVCYTCHGTGWAP
jgi:hypothetical protein